MFYAEIVITALIVALAFWAKHPFLWLMGAPAAVMFGLSLLDRIDSPLSMTLTWVCISIGGFCLFKMFMYFMGGRG